MTLTSSKERAFDCVFVDHTSRIDAAATSSCDEEIQHSTCDQRESYLLGVDAGCHVIDKLVVDVGAAQL